MEFFVGMESMILLRFMGLGLISAVIRMFIKGVQQGDQVRMFELPKKIKWNFLSFLVVPEVNDLVATPLVSNWG
jgi:hypothetical protein